MAFIEVVPAYGRDYKNQAEVKKDWNADKDFQDTVTGSYTNKSDCKNLGLSVIVRYSRQMKVMQVTK